MINALRSLSLPGGIIDAEMYTKNPVEGETENESGLPSRFVLVRPLSRYSCGCVAAIEETQLSEERLPQEDTEGSKKKRTGRFWFSSGKEKRSLRMSLFLLKTR